MKIVITGASGQLGRAVIDRLLERLPGDQIAVSVRDPKKVAGLEERKVRVRQADFDNAAALTQAFEGASQVLIISPNAGGEVAIRLHRTAIEVAKAVGANRILYTSHMGASAKSHFPPMLSHAAAEKTLESCGVAFTSLRNGFYASTPLWLLGEALKSGELALPEDGPVSWTAHADLAEATAIVLTKGGFEGVTPPLTGSEAIDFSGIAAMASELVGRNIRRIVVSDDKYHEGMLSRGVPKPVADMSLGMFLASRNGEFSKVDPTLASLIGRPTMSLTDVLKKGISIAAKGK